MLAELFGTAWRTVTGGLVFAAALVWSRLAFQFAGISPPRLPAQAPEAVAGWYLLGGSPCLTAGMVLPSRGIRASGPIRWFALATFLFVGFGVSTTVEASIYSSTDGVVQMIALLLIPCAALAGIAAVWFGDRLQRPSFESPPVDMFLRRSWGQWSVRIVVAIVAFPLMYFVFGIMVSPVVSSYYEAGVSGLVLPEPGVIVSTQLLRGGLHLMAALPVVFLWRRSRRHLAVSLGLAFFVFVAAYDFVLAYKVPVVLVVAHGIEVLLSSLAYAWILVAALVREVPEGSGKAV